MTKKKVRKRKPNRILSRRALEGELKERKEQIHDLQNRLEAFQERATDLESRYFQRLHESQYMWVTREGVRIYPRDMEEEHLRNSISYVQRRLVHAFGTTTWVASCAPFVEALHEFLKEAKRRGIRV